ncbi:hemolysin secretion protein D [Klebsiella sp. RIT-PI-d]|uniref:efflux RND transporter periplasmic adaptor subunit n=1 Tax=Klebsiella sp. RIT-PI-d TaxID=1681196 RepID=UPI000676575C|nr:efflux RND transporter periplasmic adaptor subunit [Klebsiella sp. RIT-PI-d]KNC11136.1 hemolysin secretion protein D [Klebsiella sp. RIT-PI-d]
MFRVKLLSVAVGLMSLFITACGDSAQTEDPRTQPPLVRVASVQSTSNTSLTFTGTVASRVESDLGFRVAGKIQERLVDKGQNVKAGQPLMLIDSEDLSLQARAQEQAVAAAKARANQTAEDERRYRGLVETGAISASAYDQVKAQAATAQADLKAAIAQANVARNATNYAVLKADADGTVMDTLAEPGQVVSAGQTVVRLARAGQREAVINLPETLRPRTGSEAMASLYGDPRTSVNAILRQLSDSADPLTRTFEARYVLDSPLSLAPLGSTVSVKIHEEDSVRGIIVPAGAIHDAGKGPGVWRVVGKPAKVLWTPVKIISLGSESVVVNGDVGTNNQIVALGAHLLHDGEQVRPLLMSAPGVKETENE